MSFGHGRKQLEIENVGVGALHVRIRVCVMFRSRVTGVQAMGEVSCKGVDLG
jgi:hypothetical protein